MDSGSYEDMVRPPAAAPARAQLAVCVWWWWCVCVWGGGGGSPSWLARAQLLRCSPTLRSAVLCQRLALDASVRTCYPEEQAEYLAAAWERRWKGVLPERRAPRPRFMHSNLGGWVGRAATSGRHLFPSLKQALVYPRRRGPHTATHAHTTHITTRAESFDEIVAMWRLPPRIRPVAFAFGTLADGFLPFDTPGLHPSATCAGGEDPAPPPQQGQQQAAGEQGSSSGGDVARAGGGGAGGGGGSSPSGGRVELKMCSVVMKAVQARHPGGGAGPCSTESGEPADLLLCRAGLQLQSACREQSCQLAAPCRRAPVSPLPRPFNKRPRMP